mmetsp:Transcript_25872/g.59701  ORF Transcript_25872/g.59701 Transcript_25872/m.59701 type:complete len:220 (-) Transcript_25872:42-701(-)
MERLKLEKVEHACLQVLNKASVKPRQFRESIELQVGLRGYDRRKDKAISARVWLPHMPRPRMRVGILGNEADCEKARSLGLFCMSRDEMAAFNKNKKRIKRLFLSAAEQLLASDSLIRSIPRLLGPTLHKLGRFPAALMADDDLELRVAEMKCLVRIRQKPRGISCLGLAVGHRDMLLTELKMNCLVAINFVVSILKQYWTSVKSIHLKSTMGKAIRLI